MGVASISCRRRSGAATSEHLPTSRFFVFLQHFVHATYGGPAPAPHASKADAPTTATHRGRRARERTRLNGASSARPRASRTPTAP